MMDHEDQLLAFGAFDDPTEFSEDDQRRYEAWVDELWRMERDGAMERGEIW